MTMAILWTAGVACTAAKPPPELLSPAPQEAESCFHLPVRQQPLNPSTLLDALSGHAPSELPAGLGLYGLWGELEGSGAPRGYAIWVDGSCRSVAVTTWATSEQIDEGPRVGLFTLTSEIPSTCVRPGPAPCLAYRAPLSPGLVEVAIVGIDRVAADGIVRKIE
jgi:hypothetical protein